MYQYIKFIPQLDLVADTFKAVDGLIEHFKAREKDYKDFHHQMFIKELGVSEKIVTLN